MLSNMFLFHLLL